SRNSRTDVSNSTAVGRSCISRLHEIEELQLHLDDAPAERGQLDVLHAVEEGLRLHHADDAPLEVAEDLPPADDGGVDRDAGCALVGGEESLALAQPGDGLRVGAEPPRADTEPPEVLHRIAGVRELPVDH